MTTKTNTKPKAKRKAPHPWRASYRPEKRFGPEGVAALVGSKPVRGQRDKDDDTHTGGTA